ncbi:MAG: efflux RND transporter permease subunit [Candidatus Binatus sp.]|uniref:efflux RND transporter permease subunit n=2 Tax=Candidatus Binatus sp. TaxID=2811406 RepID=UPI003C788C5A
MAHRSDDEIIRTTHNLARFCVENRAISWVLLVGVLVWGVFGYARMPKRKDPDVPVREAVAICPWPGVNAQQVEQMVTRKIEATIAQNSFIHPAGASTNYGIRSVTLDGVAIVYIQLDEKLADAAKQFNDINLKLNSIDDLPSGAGPIEFQSDFGDTAALMLTVASPREGEVQLALRARAIRAAIERTRETARAGSKTNRVSLVTLYPHSIGTDNVVRARDGLAQYLSAHNIVRDLRTFGGSGFVGIDGVVGAGSDLPAIAGKFIADHVGTSVFPAVHPDAWPPVLIRNSADTESVLMASAGDKYTYRELDRYTDLIQRALETLPNVEKISRSGVLPQWVQLAYSQKRLASYGVTPSRLSQIIADRNITRSGGMINAGGTDVTVHPTGEFTSAPEIGDVIVQQSLSGVPLYLRDLVDVLPGYENPPRLLNFYTWRDSDGRWNRSRAVTLAIFMRPGQQIGKFGLSIDRSLEALRSRLPEDLIMARTSDQPRQVRENLDLLMTALYEAIVLVVLVAWLGFWEWRSALLIALSIPITLAMTFGMMYVLGIDLQQVSIATLIIALGLLVDDPVVAGDAIKHELGMGRPSTVAAWLGPTKLARAILFATITNIVAYLPFLMISGDTGEFLYSLPIVMTCALVASRIVSMTFIPQLGYYLMRPGKPLPPIEYRRTHGVTGVYYKLGHYALEHRKVFVACSFLFLGGGVLIGTHLRSAFFPEDVQYLAYIDVWLRNGAAISDTNMIADEAEAVVRHAAANYGREHPGRDGKPREILKSVTSFVGGGGPRFWFSAASEAEQSNYAQLIIEIYDKEDMPKLVGPLQTALSDSVPGAYLDVRQLLTNPVQNPIEVHVQGQEDLDPAEEDAEIDTLRRTADQVEDVLRATPGALRVRTDWMEESPIVKLPINADRANLAGVSNADVARSAAGGLSGWQVGSLLDGDLQIPIVARLRQEERAQLADVSNLYVYATSGPGRVPIDSLVPMVFQMSQERIVRRDHFRTMTVTAFPAPGVLPSEVLSKALPKIDALRTELSPGYRILIGGEQASQDQAFGELTIVLGTSVTMIFIALVLQFDNLIKPWLVFTAVPYGVVGALAALWLTGTPFGFMAFLGVASLVGVIVSHVIVLFEFIEERQELGEELIQGLLDAGIERLRPVMVTVGATLLALFPLALHGGPLWRPLCFAQIGGLSLATVIELVLVKSFYAIFVADLGILKWGPRPVAHPE